MSHHPRSTSAFVATALPLLWIGLVLGVSFLATPAKFKAGPMDGALSLAISVVTFAWLHAAEAIAAVAVSLALMMQKAGLLRWSLLALAVITLFLQVGWVLPGFQGDPGVIPGLPLLTFGQLHMAFALMEGTKILALLALSFIAFRSVDVRQTASNSDETPIATTRA